MMLNGTPIFRSGTRMIYFDGVLVMQTSYEVKKNTQEIRNSFT